VAISSDVTSVTAMEEPLSLGFHINNPVDGFYQMSLHRFNFI
jgi:hypothetical protein